MSRSRRAAEPPWAAITLAGGVAVAGAASLAWWALRPTATPPFSPSLHPELPTADHPPEMAPVAWAGGDTRQNVDALRFMLASENPELSPLVWALQALAANNWTRVLARKHPRIVSLSDMLQSGVDKRAKRRLYDLGWGPQANRKTGIVRWASTSAGRTPARVAWHFTEFAERILQNKLDLPALLGRRGEQMPPERDWTRITSFLQYEKFGETVVAQVGEDAETDPDKVVAAWGNPRLLASVEGVRFYGH